MQVEKPNHTFNKNIWRQNMDKAMIDLQFYIVSKKQISTNYDMYNKSKYE